MRFLLLPLVTLTALFAAAQAGTLDATFGSNGITRPAISVAHSYAHDLVVLPDDRFVVVGAAWNGTTNETDWLAIRFMANGEVDSTFGTNGFTLVDINIALEPGETAKAAVLQPDGKLVMAGNSWNGVSERVAAVRLNVDGMLDDTFGSNGITILPLDAGIEDLWLSDLLLLPDSSFLLTGWADRNSSYHEYGGSQALWHLLPDGTTDNGFGQGSLLERDLFQDQADDAVNHCTLHPDGRVVMTGRTRVGSYHRMSLSFMNTDGTLPSGFNEGYYTIAPLANGEAYDVLPMDNGDHVLIGEATSDLTVVRVDEAGVPVAGFGTDGVARFGVGPGNTCIPNQALRGASDQALVLGSLYYGPQSWLYLYGIDLHTGQADSTFADNGLLAWRVHPDTATWGAAIGLQSDGRIVLAGMHEAANNVQKLFVARFANDFTTAQPENAALVPLQVWPNPVCDNFTVAGNEARGVLRLFDVWGREVLYRTAASERTEVDVRGFRPGTYTLQYSGASPARIARVTILD